MHENNIKGSKYDITYSKPTIHACTCKATCTDYEVHTIQRPLGKQQFGSRIQTPYLKSIPIDQVQEKVLR
ncbi:hypothetical protein EUGRSUZ_K02820 [Eucalyptus grandis]|uniref:Uncharacterized protein n=2 Tax=Eucalyptus grandis TaxID=71139 RepID=A0ACC3IXQ3_EUCGR|nr:hypothetical protein EUGRSUZ_K02820 [Eucalyptus grandis]